MFPVLRYVPGVVLDPGIWARQTSSTWINFLLATLFLFHSSIIHILDFGYVPPSKASVPTLTDIFAAIYSLVYPPATYSPPPNYHCFLHTSTFSVCISEAAYTKITESVFTRPSVHDVVVLLTLWFLSLPAVADFALRAFKFYLEAAWPQAPHEEASTEIKDELRDLRDELKSYRDQTEKVLADNTCLSQALDVERAKMPIIREEIVALSSALKNVTAREREAAATLAEAREAQRLAVFASAERQESLRAKVTERERQVDATQARLTQTRLNVKTLKDTLAAEEVEAAEARHNESLAAEAKLAEVQAAFHHAALAFESTIADLEGERHRIRDEAARLEAVALDTRIEHDLARAQATLQIEVAEDELAQLIEAERVLGIKKSSAQHEYEMLLLQVSSIKVAIRDAEVDDAVNEAALFDDSARAEQQRADALEEEVVGLEAAVRDAVAQYEAVQCSLKSSIAEHRSHMTACTEERESTRQQLQFLENWVAADQKELDALQAEVASLPAEIARMASEHEENVQQLDWRITQVSEGWATEKAALEQLQAGLAKVQVAQEEEDCRHRLAVRTYHQSQAVDEAFTDDLMRTIDTQKHPLAALEARYAELKAEQDAVDAAQTKLDATLADLAEANDDLAARDAEIVTLTVELAEAARRQASFRDEVAGQKKLYAKRLEEVKEDSMMFRQRLVVEAKIQRAERARTMDRVKLREAAARMLVPGGPPPRKMGHGSSGLRDVTNVGFGC
ncbi:hypothetical protein PHLGIDRAFT_512530 [Phlebiopsis gigantea 11061_1 CR5-6]|uniref:Uncharacterized protein n=1 Tax=Phlebiopsis gigantea (strain 11061_1 CR5-6) TaxID=745531 RepID=A0A0C3RYS1_PHLG1|nr:hypothetical protein PHLGIDRAFT_512530 [Phlebiopsis gigantea 11061_1 CR5-6]